MTEHENRESGALTFEEALRVAFAEEGVTDYDDSENPTLRTDRRECPFRSLRLIIQKHCWRDSTSEMDITEPFRAFPGVFLVTHSEEGVDQAIRELLIPQRRYNRPVHHNPDPQVVQNTNIAPGVRSYTWTIPRLTVPERSGAYDVLEKMKDFFNYLAGVGDYPPDADFFNRKREMVEQFRDVMQFLNNPFAQYHNGVYFKYHLEVDIVATRGVIDNLLSNTNNVSDAQVRQSRRNPPMEEFQVRLVRASDGRVFYFEITIYSRVHIAMLSYSIIIDMLEDSSLFDTADNNEVENSMSNAPSPRARGDDTHGGVGGGVGSSVVSGTIFSSNEKLNLRLSDVLDELEMSVNKLQ